MADRHPTLTGQHVLFTNLATRKQKKTMKHLFLFHIFLIGLTTISIAQNTFSKEELKSDIDAIYLMVSEIHPDMFANISQEAYETKIQEAKSQITDNMSRLEFYRISAPLVSCFKDGHTMLNFDWTDLQKMNGKHFPYSVSLNLQHPSLVIKSSFNENDSPIPDGAQILSINNKSAIEIINNIVKLVSGETGFYKEALINMMSFPYMATQFIGDSIFSVEYFFNDSIFSKTLNGVRYRQIFNALQNTEEDLAPYSLKVDEDNAIAIINFNRFLDLDRFSLFLDSTFTLIQENNISDLIIDLRKNLGGNSLLGDALFQYISNVPFKQFGKAIVKTSERQKQFHYEYFGAEQNEEIGYKIFDDATLNEFEENHLRFKGKVYLLTSHSTYSSAASFAWTFKYFEVGTIIGEETGGQAVCFGDMIIQKLPNTGLMMGISHKKYYDYGATDENTHGTIPHYQVVSDKAMDYAIELILNGRQ